MKKRTLAALALLVIAGSFLLGRYCFRVPVGPAHPSPIAGGRELEPDDEYLSGKTLIVLVDGTDVYLGSDRAPKEGIEEYVARTMELNRAKMFLVCGSETARYGDVVTLIGRLKKRGLKLATISTRPVPAGVRLALLDTDPYGY